MSNITIILMNPSHPGNIGGAARAMKNMGLSQLTLVQPKQFPHSGATLRAAGADDVLENARVVDTLAEALDDAQLIFGTSARDRRLPWPLVSPRDAAVQINTQPDKRCAIVFGRESSGLTNEELGLCHYHIHIPTVTEFSSLNLAAAVQVVAYELFVANASGRQSERVQDEDQKATGAELKGFFEHLHDTMIDVTFLNPRQPKKLMQRLQRLYARADLSTTEINILRGFLAAVQRKVK